MLQDGEKLRVTWCILRRSEIITYLHLADLLHLQVMAAASPLHLECSHHQVDFVAWPIAAALVAVVGCWYSKAEKAEK